MTVFDISVVALGASITGALYLYLLNERRKLHEGRRARHTPAE